MDPSRMRSPSSASQPISTAVAASSSSTSASTSKASSSFNHILRTIRGGGRSASSASPTAPGNGILPSTPLAPITTSLPASRNPFEPGTSASLEPISPYDLTTIEPPQGGAYDALFDDLRRPLPATAKERDEAVRQRIPKVRALAAAVERQSGPKPIFADDVPLAEVFRLCTLLLTAEQPQKLRIETCNLLTLSVKLADKRAANASPALTELRNGAPGSLSSKIPDSDQPLASIDRALFYRLVLSVSASEIDDEVVGDNSRIILAGLPAQLGALEVLAKDGRDVVGFPGLIVTLTRWLDVAWIEVQRIRAQLQPYVDETGRLGREGAKNDTDEMAIQQTRAISQLSAVERDVQVCLRLLTGILKYSFARIPLPHAEMVICSAAELIIGESSANAVTLPGSAIGSPPLKSTPLLGPQRSSVAATPSSRRSRSRDARPLVDGYSYYGLETISSTPGSNETSPSATPRSSYKPVSIDAVTTQLHASATASSAKSTGAAPMMLATLGPSRQTAVTTSTPRKDSELFASSYWVGPELHLDEVRSCLKLLDASLRYGHLPSACIDVVVKMLCRLLGYSRIDPRSPGFIPSKDVHEADWHQEVLPILSNILRSHCANAAIRSARIILTGPSASTKVTQPEDPAVLVGAVSFFRLAFTHVAEQEQQKQQGTASATSNKPQKEDALAPSLTLTLIMPALRAALKRQCDALDLEVLDLVSDLLPSAPPATESQLTPSKRATSERQAAADRSNPRTSKSVREELFARSDWEALLDLTIEAKRHLEGLKLTNASFDLTSTRSGTASGSTAAITPSAVTQTSPVLAMLKLLDKLNIAHPPKASSESMESDQRPTVDGEEAVPAHSPPWTPKLASFLLTLSPILPDATISKLVRYYWTQHLCLPSNPDWLSNIRALLQAFFYRTPSRTSTSEQGARYDLVSLVFDHVYNAVQDLTAERDLFMTDIVLPLANSTLSSENDTRTESLLRSVLVHAAVLSGSQIPGPIDPDTEAVQSATANQADTDLEEVFVEVRKLLCRLARSAPAHKTVAFETPADETEDDRTDSRPTRGNHLSETKARNAALDLIAIFNRMAFSTPWIANSVDRDIDLSIRQRWERKTRAGCIAIFRDLLDLLKVRPASGSSSSSSAGSACTSTRLAILEWMLRLRTDRQHRVYITGDLDDLVCASAAILMKGPAAADDGLDMGRQQSSASNVDGRSRAASKAAPVAVRSEREGRDTQRSADPTTRSVSRLRDLSRERGRSERSSDSNKRHAGERDRSTSQNRAQRPASYEHLWRLPQTVSFEMPAISLRSDIIYTYIHERNDMECCAGNTHLHSDKDNKPAPVPVSEFLAIAIDILRSEPDWEVVSYLLCHLPHQLSNKHLFCGPKAQLQVLHLRKDICQGILDDALLPKVVLPDALKKTDVTAVVYETLVTLISYRTLFSRAEQDEMVDAFIRGLKKSHTTARSCIKALSIACYEMQKSFTRFFSHMLLTLTAVRSHMTMSVHILELIATVAQHPSCYANFTETDYKRVFSIVLQYIEYHQSPEAATRDDYRASPATFSLSQYVMLMAFYNISLWFVILKIGDRPKYLPYISRGLLKANEAMEALSDQTQVCFDFLARFTHSNADSKPRKSFVNQLIMGAPSAGPGRGTEAARHSKTWLMGNGLLTVSTAKKAGWVEIVIRRPSGTATMLCKLENVPMGILPDENGEKDQLPALLMMNRDPEVMDSPTLDAPTDELTEPTAMTEGEHTQGTTDKQIGSNVRRRVEERLEVSDRLRARRPLGPAHFGLAPRPRSSSVSVKNTRSSIVHSGALSDELAESSLAMRQVMRDLLRTADKSSATIDGQGTSNAPITAAKAKITTKEPEVDPSFFALQLSTYPDMLHDTAPIPLPDEPATARLIKAIDFTPVVDFHKIGVLYVGPGQEEEVDILSNRHGSRAYTRFLQGLGHLVTLKGQEDVYTGGLDRNNDEHGKHAYVWTDEICQIVYHTATLMPNDERDPIRRSKKALIGNDFVHIVFNESGRDYKFGTIAGQFNYVNVCISPMTRGGVNLGSANPDDAVFYQVTLQRRPGMPDFSPVGDGQLLSAEALPTFVRILALHSNVASQIYLDTGEAMQPYSSNWVSRLGHIRRARQQHLAKKAKAEGVDPASVQGMSANSAMAGLYDFTKTF
ncbi:potential GTPase Activating protein [Pseudozyma hubeiensis SY62]|uniref:Potential GTPase Activating protein n=1 Tax=Pseudozyma hubeiensis (strain SY62) TaxID=1305764 RepID=R9PH02_PSEHS|nr:potential GTPase Activating protein [Pseudozyma hubeiensis SY62]GAC97350.1 potential GTPase Activating protein [Pseudozyma hubeiensis SY62]